ncbi:hypothetical protein [Paenibacillus odorifer]|uniref:hypothetical protein n=1 Tax=Paenibacillus odorifer TaxID=189426 RepID=UPI00096F06FE|nr:hypothetical protein [Paenibacillus odorifer]OMD66899.1 hypothetical protein BSK50_30450 [Paenibacillus odorifer]
MIIKRKESNEQAFTGDIVIIRDGTVDDYYMLVEDNLQDIEDQSILYFIHLKNGISHKYIIPNKNEIQFKSGFIVDKLGIIVDVISNERVRITLE